jgi:hypothetical protein
MILSGNLGILSTPGKGPDGIGFPRTPAGIAESTAPLIITPFKKFRLEVEVLVFFMAIHFGGTFIYGFSI